MQARPSPQPFRQKGGLWPAATVPQGWVSGLRRGPGQGHKDLAISAQQRTPLLAARVPQIPAGRAGMFSELCRSPGLPLPQSLPSPSFAAVRPGLWPAGFRRPLPLPLLCVPQASPPNLFLALPSVLASASCRPQTGTVGHRGDSVKNRTVFYSRSILLDPRTYEFKHE